MLRARVFYNQSGRVVEIEHRVDEHYTPETITREQMEGISTLVVDTTELEGMEFEEVEVRQGKVRKARRRGASSPEEAKSRRIQQILEMDKSSLSDQEWLTLFREYVTLSGRF